MLQGIVCSYLKCFHNSLVASYGIIRKIQTFRIEYLWIPKPYYMDLCSDVTRIFRLGGLKPCALAVASPVLRGWGHRMRIATTVLKLGYTNDYVRLGDIASEAAIAEGKKPLTTRGSGGARSEE